MLLVFPFVPPLGCTDKTTLICFRAYKYFLGPFTLSFYVATSTGCTSEMMNEEGVVCIPLFIWSMVLGYTYHPQDRTNHVNYSRTNLWRNVKYSNFGRVFPHQKCFSYLPQWSSQLVDRFQCDIYSTLEDWHKKGPPPLHTTTNNTFHDGVFTSNYRKLRYKVNACCFLLFKKKIPSVFHKTKVKK